jgi:hypothetical protein
MSTTTSGLLASLMGDTTLVVGVEDELMEGCLKVYVGMRSLGFYVLIQDPEAQREVRSAWGGRGHVLIPLPPQGHLYRDGEARS